MTFRTPSAGERRAYTDPVAVGEPSTEAPQRLVWIDWQDGPHISVGLATADGIVTTESTQDWPAIEQHWPRDTWPRETYAGKGWEGRHDAEPSLRAILDAEVADYQTDLDEADAAQSALEDAE